MDITNKEVNDYILDSMPDVDAVLSDMHEYAKENDFPIIGKQCGTLLRQLALATGAKNIFEMGSGFGYSAYWFAGGIPDDGRIICTEGSEENKTRALEYLKMGGFDSKVDFHAGYAQEIIKKYDGPFDIILIDVDKEQYPECFELALPRLRKGGLMITDNVLWSGRVLDDEPNEETAGIQKFNKMLMSSDQLLSNIIPLRDGLGFAVKL